MDTKIAGIAGCQVVAVYHTGSEVQDLDAASDRPLNHADAVLDAILGNSAALWHSFQPIQLSKTEGARQLSQILARANIQNACGKRLFVQASRTRSGNYDTGVLLEGRLNFRPGSFHDWFNVLSWLEWPLAKAALNLRYVLHYFAAMREQGFNPKTQAEVRIARNLQTQRLTSFEEGGCIATTWLKDTYLNCDERHVYHWREYPATKLLQQHLGWYGHAVLECWKIGTGHDHLRMAVLFVPSLIDWQVAQRMLTFASALESDILGSLEDVPEILPAFRSALQFSDADPFGPDLCSLLPPWPHLLRRDYSNRSD